MSETETDVIRPLPEPDLAESRARRAHLAWDDPTEGWLYAMPVYSSLRRDSGAQVIAATPEACIEAMWAAKCEIDGYRWEDWEPTWRRLHADGTPTTEGREDDIRVVPA